MIFKKNNVLVILLLIAIAFPLATGFYNPFKKDGNNDFASKAEQIKNVVKAEYIVEGITCSSCIQDIKDCLGDISGVQTVLVDPSSKSVQVYYDDSLISDNKVISDALSKRGYSSTLSGFYTTDELKKTISLKASKSENYIASVGGLDISREEFKKQVDIEKAKYENIYGSQIFISSRGKQLIENMKKDIFARLVDESVVLQEIVKSGFKLKADEVDVALTKYLKPKNMTISEFKSYLAKQNTDYDYFYRKFSDRVLINKYLEKNVYKEFGSDYEKQQQFSSWFNNAKTIAQVVIFDKDLESLQNNTNTAQGGCCATN
jgi:copper chaperone CopZ